MHDLKSNLSAQATLAPAIRTAGANGLTVDRQGFDGILALALFGAYTDGSHTPVLQESPDGTTWTNSAAADLLGGFSAVTSGAGANTVQQIGYIGLARYLRLVMTISGTTGGAQSAGVIVRGYASQQPVA